MSDPATPTNCGTSALDLLNCGSGAASSNEGTTFDSLLAAIAGSLASFGIQVAVFLLLRLKLSRIYRPRSYLVPERERVKPPPSGFYQWLGPLFTTSNLAFVQKCGLDAYFFLRYLRMLLKLFLPITIVLTPILLPINRYSGNGSATGLDLLSISNVAPAHKGHRLWAHLLLALGVIAWFNYVIYKEMRGYIRVRQAYLTSPQHRIRASATTVLVTGIPRKWLTLEALSGLYDVFPGGIKNIWINRNFDELSDKVKLRNKIAKKLEGAETDLIKKCRKKHEEAEAEKAKKEGAAKKTKQEMHRKEEEDNADADQMAQGNGVSAGDQHNTPHGLHDVLVQAEAQEHHRQDMDDQARDKQSNPLAAIGQGLDRVGLGAVGQGFGLLGKGVTTLGQKVVGNVDNGIHKAGGGLNSVAGTANNGLGFATDESLYRQSGISTDGPPTPPPKTPAEEREARLEARKSTPLSSPVQTRGPLDSPDQQRHPLAYDEKAYPDRSRGSPASDRTLQGPDIDVTRPSVESKPKMSMQIELPDDHQASRSGWKFWQDNDHSFTLPSPQPHTADDDAFPLQADAVRATAATTPGANQAMSKSKLVEKLMFWKKDKDEKTEEKERYPDAITKEWDEDADGEPRWRRYIEPKDRDTLRLPLIGQAWFPALPLVGKKIDKIYHLRRELARLNLEIEADQEDVEKFPLMNSAFIQFNHQVAAHMACQSLSHHVPQQMAPRLVEISPNDILWDNLSIKWWERYIRTGTVLVVSAGLIIVYAIPVSFSSLLSKVSLLAQSYTWLAWLTKLPAVVIAIIQGLLPAILISVILMLVPMIFRMLIKQQGVPTGNNRELGVQQWYFAFLFIQVFLIVTISGGLISFFTNIAADPGKVVTTLATSLPKAADYFFSYLFVQALSNSASALVQVGSLLGWFVLAPLLDSTPRAKWRRQTNLSNVQWGSFFPPFTNFAVIGIIYSVIAPFILFFMLIIFALFWIVYRYNVLYVYQFQNDTGGLLFPSALNQLFTGIYIMEIGLVGYFFISEGPAGNVVCIPQAIIMIVALVATILYQWQLNITFAPLFQYLPITLEDEAVIRDEEFARAQASKFAPLRDGEGEDDDADAQDIQEILVEREKQDEAYEEAAEETEKRDIEERRHSGRLRHGGNSGSMQPAPSTPSKSGSQPQQHAASQPNWKTDRWRSAAPQAVTRIRNLGGERRRERKQADGAQADLEAQHTVGDVLFSGFADELEDLTPDERDLLVRYAFQHSALRAKRPVVWIPRDKLGVSDDEISRAKRVSTIKVHDDEKGMVEKTNIWMSNEGTALDGKGRVVFRRSPPDFSNVDLIAL